MSSVIGVGGLTGASGEPWVAEQGALTAAIDHALKATEPDDTAVFTRQAARRLLANGQPPKSSRRR